MDDNDDFMDNDDYTEDYDYVGMDDKTRALYESLTDMERIEALIIYIDDLRGLIFDMEQKVDLLEKETDVRLTEEERLQRKDVWSKPEVCDYYNITAKTFERWKKSGEIKVRSVGGKDYVLKKDMDDRLKDKQD